MNEELQENNRETELELREELDLTKNRVQEAKRKIGQLEENITDHQETIAKFRQLTATLQVSDQMSLVLILKQTKGDLLFCLAWHLKLFVL